MNFFKIRLRFHRKQPASLFRTTGLLRLFNEITAVCRENHTKHTKAPFGLSMLWEVCLNERSTRRPILRKLFNTWAHLFAPSCLAGLIKTASLAVGRGDGSTDQGEVSNLSHFQVRYSQFHKTSLPVPAESCRSDELACLYCDAFEKACL
jgi:hypothetical protein